MLFIISNCKYLVVFPGNWYAMIQPTTGIVSGYPRRIQAGFNGLPGNLDAAVEGFLSVYFFKVRYRSVNWEIVYILSRYYYFMYGASCIRIKLYISLFFQGSQIWKYDLDLAANTYALATNYPKDLATIGLPSDIDMAFTWSATGRTYVTKGINWNMHVIEPIWDVNATRI
jgi:hypothetical protein